MAHKARMAASISPSSLFRAVDAAQVSIMIDEGDNVFKNANPELLAIINSGSDRMAASVMRTESVGDGQFVSRDFKCFTAIALTSIQQVPDTLQDRCIALALRRAMKHEKPERLTIRTRGPLIDVGRQFDRWAADLKALPDPSNLADLFNRIEDKWFVLFQIALLAGGTGRSVAAWRRWPISSVKRRATPTAARKAICLAMSGAFSPKRAWCAISTKELGASLIALERVAVGALPIGGRDQRLFSSQTSARFSARERRGDRAEKWTDTKGQKLRGFHERHFQDAFERYLGKGLPSKEPKSRPIGTRHAPARGV